MLRLQRRRGLPVKGFVDARTQRALAAAPDARRGKPANTQSPKAKPPRPTAIALTGMDPAVDQTGWLVLTALMALVLGAVAGLLAGRLRPTPSQTPAVALARGVVAEGMARAASIGRFRGHVHALVLGRRLSNSAAELSRVLEWVARSGGRLVVLDVGLDTASDAGRIAANSLVRVGSWERRRVLERTRKGLAAARARRTSAGWAAVEDVPALKQRILDMRSEGVTLQGIADQLNEDGVPTLRGGQLWRPSSVQAALGYRRPSRRPDEGVDTV